jgi:hypothetical protein
MRLIIAAAAVLAVACPAAAFAQDTFVGARISTLGAGAELGYDVNDRFTVRALANGLNINHDTESSDIDYSGKLKLSSFGVQGDFRFTPDGPLYVTAGVYANNNKVHATATPSGNTEVGGTTYTPQQIGTLTADGKFGGTAPYLGIGGRWGMGAMEFTAEAGAFFQGKPKVTLTSNGTYSSNPAYQSSLEQERQDLQDDLDDLKTWPVVALGLRYTF